MLKEQVFSILSLSPLAVARVGPGTAATFQPTPYYQSSKQLGSMDKLPPDVLLGIINAMLQTAQPLRVVDYRVFRVSLPSPNNGKLRQRFRWFPTPPHPDAGETMEALLERGYCVLKVECHAELGCEPDLLAHVVKYG